LVGRKEQVSGRPDVGAIGALAKLDGGTNVAVKVRDGVLIAGIAASFGADWVGDEQGGVVEELSLEA
jgi:hypothetical protein